jgi:hypothetical protein
MRLPRDREMQVIVVIGVGVRREQLLKEAQL